MARNHHTSIPGRTNPYSIHERSASYSGADIAAYFYIPTRDSLHSNKISYKKFAEMQTISVSSTRSLSPVRVLGRSNPIEYTRGGRTFAGTMVFATFEQDAFADVYRSDIAESAMETNTSMFVDQLPPFTIVITASNELGSVAQQIISGITIVNYGVTYSIDDVYTESTYTYVATDVTPLLTVPQNRGDSNGGFVKTPFQILQDQYTSAYGTRESTYKRSPSYAIESHVNALVEGGLLSAAESLGNYAWANYTTVTKGFDTFIRKNSRKEMDMREEVPGLRGADRGFPNNIWFPGQGR